MSVDRFYLRLAGSQSQRARHERLAAIRRAALAHAAAGAKAALLPPCQPVTRPVVRRRKRIKAKP